MSDQPNSAKVTRYSTLINEPGVEVCGHGYYVSFPDYEALARERDELETKLIRAWNIIDELKAHPLP